MYDPSPTETSLAHFNRVPFWMLNTQHHADIEYLPPSIEHLQERRPRYLGLVEYGVVKAEFCGQCEQLVIVARGMIGFQTDSLEKSVLLPKAKTTRCAGCVKEKFLEKIKTVLLSNCV